MSTKLKLGIARVSLVIGGLAFVSGALVLCYCPESFILPAALSVLSALLGSRWIRVASICLFLASIAMGIHDYRGEKHLESIVRAFEEKQRAATNSVTK
jgi:hypothetical protein